MASCQCTNIPGNFQACADTCQSKCKGNTSSSSSGGGCSCGTNCSRSCAGTCFGECSSECSGGCSSGCSGGCTGDCSGSCRGDCDSSCKNTCEDVCTGCTETCADDCTSACTGNCTKSCTGLCATACGHNCSATSNSSYYTEYFDILAKIGNKETSQIYADEYDALRILIDMELYRRTTDPEPPFTEGIDTISSIEGLAKIDDMNSLIMKLQSIKAFNYKAYNNKDDISNAEEDPSGQFIVPSFITQGTQISESFGKNLIEIIKASQKQIVPQF